MDKRRKTCQCAGCSWWRMIMLNSQPCPALSCPATQLWGMRIVVWSVSLNGRRLRGRERERETLPRQRYGSQVVYITRRKTRQAELRGGDNLDINLAWQALSDVRGGGGGGRCSPAPDRRAGRLAVIIQWLGRSISSYHLSPIMSAAKLLLQASLYNLTENFACLVVVMMTNVESNFWIVKLLKTLELTVLITLWWYSESRVVVISVHSPLVVHEAGDCSGPGCEPNWIFQRLCIEAVLV